MSSQTRPSILQGAKTHIYSLKSKEPKSMAVGSVFMDFEANKAVIALQDVPPLQLQQI